MSHVGTSPEYDRAKARVQKKRKLRTDLLTHIAINAFLVVVWAFTGLGFSGRAGSWRYGVCS
ncbi:hypothetical protein [Streptomyces sp. NPDC058735]|uniref:hypothetical protein n=1 Tax=unclassified Streptomyces TaxID=2593676 RepID=UPI0036B11A20